MAFDLLRYQKDHKTFYGDSSLEDVAKDVYQRGEFAKEQPDFNSWKQSSGIEPIIQEDIKRRTPPTFWDKLVGATNHVAPQEDTSILEEIPKGLVAGVQQVKGFGYGLSALAGEAVGSDVLRKFGAEGLAEVEKNTPKPQVASFTDIQSGSDLAKYLAYGIATNIPNMALSIAGGGIGGILGKKAVAAAAEAAVSKAAASKIIQQGITRGAVAGAGASSIGMEAGSIAGGQLTETGQVDPLRAIAGAIPAGLLDVLPEYKLAKRLGWLGKDAADFAGNRFVQALKVGAQQFMWEAPTEAMQSVFERGSVEGKSLTNKDAQDEYINSFILGGLTGAVVGGGSHAVTGLVKGKPAEEESPVMARLRNLASLNGIIFTGMKEGSVADHPFTPTDAIEIIRKGQSEGLYTEGHVDWFKEQYPQLRDGLNGLIAERVVEKVNQVLQEEAAKPALKITPAETDVPLSVGQPLEAPAEVTPPTAGGPSAEEMAFRNQYVGIESNRARTTGQEPDTGVLWEEAGRKWAENQTPQEAVKPGTELQPLATGEVLPGVKAEEPPLEIVSPGADLKGGIANEQVQTEAAVEKPLELIQVQSLADPESFAVGAPVNFDGGVSGKVIETGKGYVLVEGAEKLFRVQATNEIPVVKAPSAEAAPESGTKSFVDNKIRELGTVEKVNAFYSGKDEVSDYARTMAPKILSNQPAPMAETGSQGPLAETGAVAAPSGETKAAVPETIPAKGETKAIYRGAGRKEGSPSVYNEFTDQKAILRNGQFWAFKEGDAKKYGPNVEQRPMPKFNNPLTIKNDDEWLPIIQKALSKYDTPKERVSYPNPFGLKPEKMEIWRKGVSDYLAENNHDALVVDIEKAEGDDAKALRNLFGHSQVFIPEVSKKPAPVATPAPESSEILIRKFQKSDTGKGSNNLLASLPEKEGYQKVYKPYGAEGKGFYYVKGAPGPVSKQPYEMTRDEWLQGVRFYRSGKTKNAQVPGGERVILSPDSTPSNFKEKSKDFLHMVRRQAIAGALKEGKTVSAEIMAEFPELDEKGNHKAVAKAPKPTLLTKEPSGGFTAADKVPEKYRKPTETSIGKNSEGQDIYEDKNGIRYVVEGNIRVTESVSMVPTRAGVEKRPVTPRDQRYEVAKENIPDGKREDPYTAAVGQISGKASRAKEHGYEFAYGETKKHSDIYWDMVGLFSGASADKLIESGITIKKIHVEAPAETRPSEAAKTEEPVSLLTPATSIAEKVRNFLTTSKAPLDAKTLFGWADEAYGGTQAQGKYSVKDAYDAMELGVNKAIEKSYMTMDPTIDAEGARNAIVGLKHNIMEKLPAQSKRTTETDQYQQFSTPPTISYLANWVANIQKGETYLEPSAGIGGLAVFGKNAGAVTVVNELSSRRRAILEQMGFDQVLGENAEQINNILPKDIKPTVVVMNPPFSATAGRLQTTSSMEGFKHVEQALKRLEPNGRAVIILGKGVTATNSFKKWLTSLGKGYILKADIGIAGSEYQKYGTTYGNQLLVIDKAEATEARPITGDVEKVEDAIDLLKGVRDERITGEQKAPEPKSETVPRAGEGTAGLIRPVLPATGDLGTGEGRPGNRLPGERVPANTDVGTAGPDDEKAGGVRPERSEGGVRSPGRPAGGQQVAGESGVGSTGQSEGYPGTISGAEQIAGSELTLEKAPAEKRKKEVLSDSVYETYRPQKVNIAGAKAHPGKLVESAAMSVVDPPDPTYTPNLPKKIIQEGRLSAAQLESIVYAGQAHSEILPSGERKGYFIGDGTGVGKGREIAGILLDNWRQGRTRAVWISQNSPLIEDAKRDIKGIGWDDSLLLDLGKHKIDYSIPAKQKGIYFAGYDLVAQKESKAKQIAATEKGLETASRLRQIVDWFGKDYDGVIIFDEAHNMGNAIAVRGRRGPTKPSAKALAGIDLQRLLPKARVVYVSATGATEVMNLSYADRLGLWGEGTPFANKMDFINQISSGGIAAMELVARDMKAMGNYLSRSLSFDDVKYEPLHHELTPQQREIYDEFAGAWQMVLAHINEAMGLTDAGKSGHGKSSALAQFWGSSQRFFNQVITSMQTPAVVNSIEKDLKAGHAVVLQIVNTQESQTNRALSRMEEGDELEDLDLTPKEQIMDYVKNSFPVAQYHPVEDENGNIKYEVVVDSTGAPVENAEAVALREELLNKLGSVRGIDGPMEILLNHFGTDKIAEITGRTRRVVYAKDDKGNKIKVIERRSKAKTMADADAFMNDKKPILIFSYAGGTGRSYHADLAVKNQRLRRHYLLQAGWRADRAIQGFGRTHRSSQKQAPEYILVTTDIIGQKRFISSIARRLDQLGALTRGQRETGSGGFFTARDNLESTYAQDALDSMILAIYHHDGIMEMPEFMEQTGLSSLVNTDTGQLNETAMPSVTQFLNRLLAMHLDKQAQVFEDFSRRLDANIRMAMESGDLDVGLETLKAKAIKKVSEQVVHTDKSGAKTNYVELDVTQDSVRRDFGSSKGSASESGYYRNVKSGQVWAAGIKRSRTDANTGEIIEHYTLRGPSWSTHDALKTSLEDAERYAKLSTKEAKDLWDKEYSTLPKTVTYRENLITGTVLPIWDRLQGKARIMRVQTDKGERMIGRIIPPDALTATLQNLGASSSKTEHTAKDIFHQVRDQGFQAELANGWKIIRRRVSGENRIELVGPDYRHMQELEKHGVFEERIQYNTRYFIPTTEEGITSIEAITATRPVVNTIAPTKIKENIPEEVEKVEKPVEKSKDNNAIDKFYAIRTAKSTGQQSGYTEIKGEIVNNDYGLDLFAHQSLPGTEEKWSVSERLTGFRVASGNTKIEAIEKSLSAIDRNGIEKVREIINKKAAESLTPWAKANNRTRYETNEVLGLGEKPVEQYSATTDQAPAPTLSDVQSIFKGQDIWEGPEGTIFIKTRSGASLAILGVDHISVSETNFRLGYARNMKEGERIVGAYGRGEGKDDWLGVVKLLKDAAGRVTLSHESAHFMEDFGIIDASDVAILRDHIRRSVHFGRIETANKQDIGGAEDRANFIADALTKDIPPNGPQGPQSAVGRIITRIREFLDRLMQAFGIRTAGAVVRDVESGRVFERGLTNAPASGTNYAVTSKPGTANTVATNTPKAESDTYKQETTSGKVSVSKSILSGASANTKDFADLLESSTFQTHGLSGFDIPTQRMVMRTVITALHDGKVRDVVIKSIPVEMVNYLATKQLTPEEFFNNSAMLHDSLSVSADGSIPIGSDAANSLVLNVALAATKNITGFPSLDFAGRPIDDSSALGTINFRHDITSNNILPQTDRNVKAIPETTPKAVGGNPFKESVVKEPVYHGSQDIFAAFSDKPNNVHAVGKSTIGGSFPPAGPETRKAHWFISDKNQAAHYANRSIQSRFLYPGAVIYKANIDLKNPLIIDMRKIALMPDEKASAVDVTSGKIYQINDRKERSLREAKTKGHDGVIFKNGYDWRELEADIYAVLSPDQINIIGSPLISTKEKMIDLKVQDFSDLPNPSRPPEVGGRVQYSAQKQSDPPTSKDPKVLNLYLKDETDAIVQTILNKFHPESMSWLETMLKSPEYFDHPQIKNIVKLFMRDRSEIYHETFNDLNAAEQPFKEYDTISEAAKALKNKGVSLADRFAGKVSPEYEHLGRIIDEGDTTWKRDTRKPLDEQIKAFEDHIRKQGATEDTIAVWKLYRQSYDKALDLQTQQLRDMIDQISEEAAFKGVEPADFSDLFLTLKGALAQMEEWKGFYAPRIREQGDWKVQAYKQRGEDKEFYREHAGSELAARRIANKLQREGWKISNVGKVERLPEGVYQDVNAVATAKLIDAALEKTTAGGDMTFKFSEEILRAVADEIRARGFRSHMIHRGESVIRGFIEDPIKRHLIYSNQLSGGISKARVAKAAMMELLGTKVMGKQVGGIDPVKDPRGYEVATNYIREQLRNMDSSDRMIGLAKSIATFKFLGFSVRSLAVNMTAVMTTAPSAIHQYAMGGKGSMTGILKELGIAGKDYGALMAGKKLSNADEQRFMDDVKKKGWDDAQYTREALGELSKVHSKIWSTLMDGSMYLFGKSEQWNRGTTMLAAYRVARKMGLDHAAAAEKAKDASDKAHGVYGRATMPMWAQGANPAAKIGQMMYVYSKFGHNYLQMLYDMGLKKHNIKGAMFAFLAPLVLAGGAALPFKDAIFGFASVILKALFGDDRDPEKWVWDTIREHLGKGAEKIGRHGLTGAAGLDISGSLSIGVGVPKNFIDLTGAIGGVATEGKEAFDSLMEGRPAKAAEHLLPAGFANPLKAIRETKEGAVTRNNRRVWDENGRPFVPSGGEAAARAFGFRSTNQAVLSERTWEGHSQQTAFANKRNAIYERFRAWTLGGRDRDEYQKIIKETQEYNASITKQGVRGVSRITSQSLRDQAKRMQRPSKNERALLAD